MKTRRGRRHAGLLAPWLLCVCAPCCLQSYVVTCVHCFPHSCAQHWRSVCFSPNAIFQEFIRTQYAAAKMRHSVKKAELSDRKCPCWTFPASPHLPHHTHTLRHFSVCCFFVNWSQWKWACHACLLFPIKICSGLDGCQGTVHGLSAETDDILLKASVEPSFGSLWGLATEGMGKGHIHVVFFTACPHDTT